MSSQRVTLKSIAERCGLGVTTVSRALKDGPEISAKTRARVQQVARELGYQPNRAGVGLRTGKTHVIALLLSPHPEVSGFGSSLMAGMTRAFQRSPYRLQVLPVFDADDPSRAGSDESLESELAVVRRVIDNREADGIIMSRTRPQDQRVRLLLESDFPFVTHGRTELATPHAYHDFDNFAFAADGVRKLLARGRRKLLLLPAPREYTYSNHLIHGFQHALAEVGLQGAVLPDLTSEMPPERIRSALGRVLVGDSEALPGAAGTEVDGVVVAGDIAGLAAMAGSRDAGRRPGDDIDFLLKQTSAALDYLASPVCRLREDLTLSGHTLGTHMLELLAGESREALQTLQAPEAACIPSHPEDPEDHTP